MLSRAAVFGARMPFSPLTQRFMATPMNRMFAAKAMQDYIPTMEMQYMMSSARVMVNLPERGKCWFFVNSDDRIEDFQNAVKSEDSQVENIEVLFGSGKKTKAAETPLYELL